MEGLSLRRECILALEARWERVMLDHLVWYTRPWYQRAVLTLLGRRPEAL